MAVRLAPNTVFAADFRVVQPLGQGGMGAVYIVEQTSTGARRALKLMLPHLAADDDARARFEREAKVGARIASDHVVQVIAAGVDEATGAPWLAMELLEGESLDARVRGGGPLSHAEARTLFAQLGHALGAAHAAGIVHRDLKPENLHLGRGRRAEEPLTLKVLDFGIAKLTLDASATATAPVGTLGWMAPEQAEADAEITPRTDVWSVGLLAFFALTGRSFWKAATSGSVPTILRELMFDALPLASERNKELGGETTLPIGFDSWFARAVIRDPGARFADGGEACRALVRLLEGSSAPVEKTAFAQPSGSRKVEAIALAPRRTRRRWGLAAGGAVAALAGALVLWKVAPALVKGPAASPASASASAAPRLGSAITGLPPPKCESAKVRALYASALQDFRDANLEHAHTRLKEAAEIEPSCAAVQLRLAMTQDGAEKVASYQRALEHRSDLGARDRALLEVVGLQGDAHHSEPAAKRALEAARAFPDDAELWSVAGAQEQRAADASASHFRTALDLDPEYAAAWEGLAATLGALGKADERRHALDRCIAISTTSADCRGDRADLAWSAGQCDDAMKDLREAIALSPESIDLRASLSRNLSWLDRPYETRLQALQDSWALLGAERIYLEPVDRMDLERSVGHNAEAERQRKVVEGLIARADTPHLLARDLIGADVYDLLLFDRVEEAARAAEAFLKRSEAWNDGSQAVPLLLHYAELRAGRIARAEYETRRLARTEALKAMMAGDDPWQMWTAAHPYVVDREEAELALAARPRGTPTGFQVRELGRWEAQVGHGQEALDLLENAARCERRPAWIERALALEQVGRRDESCEAYAGVVERFGKEEPVPHIVKMAREGIGRLHCQGKPRPTH